MTFEQYKKNRPFFSDSYCVNIIEKEEKQFFSIPVEKIHDANEKPPVSFFECDGKPTGLSVPCLVFMSDGTQYGTYVDVASFYCYEEGQWYFSCLPFAAQPLYQAYRREPTVLKWVPLREIWKKGESTENALKIRDGYYEIA